MAAHILIIDDEPVMLGALVRLLRRRGYEVDGVADPEGALRAICDPRAGYSAVLLDYSLESTNGVALAERIWAHRPGLPVILISGWDSSQLEGVSERPFAGFLHKPFLSEELELLLMEILRGAA